MPRAKNAPAAGAKQSRPRRPPGPHPFVPPSLDLEDVLRAVVASAAEISGAALVTIWTADEDARVLERQAVSDDRLAREYPFPHPVLRKRRSRLGGAPSPAAERPPRRRRCAAHRPRLVPGARPHQLSGPAHRVRGRAPGRALPAGTRAVQAGRRGAPSPGGIRRAGGRGHPERASLRRERGAAAQRRGPGRGQCPALRRGPPAAA